MTDSKGTNQGSWLTRFYRNNPAIGIAGTIASIVGVALSVYFFKASREKPELTYFVHPAKAAVVRIQENSRIEVHFDGQRLESDVTVAQVAFCAFTAPRQPPGVLTSAALRSYAATPRICPPVGAGHNVRSWG